MNVQNNNPMDILAKKLPCSDYINNKENTNMSGNRYNLSLSQEEVYVAEQIISGTGVNNILGVLTFKTGFSKEKIKKTLSELINVYDTFAIRIGVEGEKVYQYFNNDDTEIEIVEIKCKRNNYEEKLQEICDRPIFRYGEKLYRFYMIEKDDGTKDLLMVFHHLIADAWGVIFLVNTFCKCLNDNYEIDSKILSYKDYVLSEQKYLESDRYQIDKQFWRMKLSTYEGNRLFDSTIKGNRCERAVFKIDKSLTKDINLFLEKNQISLNSLFMAITALYWSLFKKTKDVSIGMLTLGRNKVSEKNMSGTFARVLPAIFKIH